MTDLDPDLEELALDCLARLETEGEGAIEETCGRHPEHAAKLRGMVRQLRKMGLLADRGEHTPERIGQYRLLRPLGGGGMGVVHLAEDEHLGRMVALKLMRGAFLADEHSRDRFQREVEALAKLDHPGICTVYEAGEHDGVPFLAMRYVKGESLRARVGRWCEAERGLGSSTGARTARTERIAEAVACVEKVARAVHAAHEHGVVHRDLKPDNVIVDPNEQPVVLDFGLARLLDAAQPTLTASSDLLGTPAYMAPEQVAGGPGLDRRTDVYGLGALLYECVTLRLPFDETRREALYRRILNDAPIDPRVHDGQVGRDLSAVILRALDKDPHRRYATAAELADELTRLLRGENVRARHPGPAARVLSWSRRNRPAAMALVAVSLALAVALVTLLARAATEQRLRAAAILHEAEKVRQQEPELAYKLAREAIWLDDDPAILARMQEMLFDLREVNQIDQRLGSLGSVEWSPDGRCLLALGPLLTGTLYDASGAQIHEFEGSPLHAGFAADGSELALGFQDGSVVRYALGDGPPQRLDDPLVHPSPVTSVRYADDGRLLVTHGRRDASLWLPDGSRLDLRPSDSVQDFLQGGFLPDRRVVAAGALWSPAGDLLAELAGQEQVYWLATAPDRILTASLWRVMLRDGHGAKVARDFGQGDPRRSVSHVELSADGMRALVVQLDGTLSLLDRDGVLLDVWRTPDQRSVQCARFRPDGGLLVGDWNGHIHLLDRQLRTELRLTGHRSGVYWLAPHPGDSRRLVTAGGDGVILDWRLDARPGLPMRAGLGHARVAADANRGRTLFASSHGTAWLTDVDSKTSQELTFAPGLAVPAFSSDGATAIVATADGTLLVLDLLGDGGVRNLSFGQPVDEMQIDGDRLLLRTRGRLLFLWNLRGEGEPHRVPAPFACVSMVAAKSWDSVLVGTWQGEVYRIAVTDSAQSDRLQPLSLPNVISHLTLSRDGERLLAACADRHAYLWHLPTSRLLARFGGHRHSVMQAEFSPDERSVITTCQDWSVRVFDLPDTLPAAGDLQPWWTARLPSVIDAQFISPARIVTAGGDGTVRFWSLTRADLGRREEAFGVKPLSDEERDRFPHLLGR